MDGYELVKDPYLIKCGNLVKYNDKEYYFQPNGSMAYLYSSRTDFMERKKENRLCVARNKLSLRKLSEFPEKLKEPESCFIPTKISPERALEIREKRKNILPPVKFNRKDFELIDYFSYLNVNDEKPSNFQKTQSNNDFPTQSDSTLKTDQLPK